MSSSPIRELAPAGAVCWTQDEYDAYLTAWGCMPKGLLYRITDGLNEGVYLGSGSNVILDYDFSKFGGLLTVRQDENFLIFNSGEDGAEDFCVPIVPKTGLNDQVLSWSNTSGFVWIDRPADGAPGAPGSNGADGANGSDGADGTDFSTVPDATAAQITNILDSGGLFGCTSTGVIRKIPTSALDSAPAGANGAQYGAPVCLPGIDYATSGGSSDNTFSYIDWVMPAGAKFLIATDGENNGSQVVYDVAEGEVVTVKLRFDTNNQNGYQSAFITDIAGGSPSGRETDCSPNLGVHLVPDLNDPNFNSLKPIINPNASDVTFTNLPGTGGGNPPFNYVSDFYVFC